ncbi:MAG TPA: biotin transporter BioY [Devosia sp.]|nr:biotin transporter BioY [Devosia sp.]
MTTPNTVMGALLPREGASRMAANVGLVIVGSLILAASAQVKIPLSPVVINLTTLAVAFLAATLGWRLAVSSVALYIAEGLMGLPFFANGGGWAYVLSPSFGFIVGYLAMAFIIGWAADRGASRSPLKLFGWMLVGDAVLFAFGLVWLLAMGNVLLAAGGELPKWLAGGDLLAAGWNVAVQPFIVWDVLKMAFAAITVAGAWQLVKSRA